MNGRPRIVHVVTTSHTGGAEHLLAAGLSRWSGRFDQAVLCLSRPGTVAPAMAAAGVPVTCLGLDGGPAAWFGAWRRYRQWRAWARDWRPDAMVGWMYHGNLAADRLGRALGNLPVVWTLHQTPSASLADEKPLTRWIIRRLAERSSGASAIIHVAEAARVAHAALGFDDRPAVVIRNGFETDRFRPDPAARRSVRRELGLPEEAPLLGRFGRWHPMKDYPTCLAAFVRYRAGGGTAELVLAGAGVSWDERAFRELAAANGLVGDPVRDHVHALGRRDDLPRLDAALDLATSTSSVKETFPLVLGEAMACGVPCVATGVGDTAYLLGDTGTLTPPGDPLALAAAWAAFFALPGERRARLGAAARERVMDHFTLERMATAYGEVFAQALAHG